MLPGKLREFRWRKKTKVFGFLKEGTQNEREVWSWRFLNARKYEFDARIRLNYTIVVKAGFNQLKIKPRMLAE